MPAPFRAIGVVGLGFVGRTVAEHFSTFFKVYGYDSGIIPGGLRRGYGNGHTLWEFDDEGYARHWAKWLTENVDGPIFICVPTPAAPHGRCDTSIVERVLARLEEHSAADYRNVAIVKSTVEPGTTDRLNRPSLGGKFTVIHNPEFLTERSAKSDFASQQDIILGGSMAGFDVAAAMYRCAFPGAAIWHATALEAECIKYARNCFYAIKLAFANELHALCQHIGANYDGVKFLTKLHPWAGQMHWEVPGPDGQLGFGGKCLPKDLAALIHLCQEQGVNCQTMLGAMASNQAVRGPIDDTLPPIPWRVEG